MRKSKLLSTKESKWSDNLFPGDFLHIRCRKKTVYHFKTCLIIVKVCKTIKMVFIDFENDIWIRQIVFDSSGMCYFKTCIFAIYFICTCVCILGKTNFDNFLRLSSQDKTGCVLQKDISFKIRLFKLLTLEKKSGRDGIKHFTLQKYIYIQMSRFQTQKFWLRRRKKPVWNGTKR